MKENKSNVGLVVALVIAIIVILGLVGYVVYDKVLSNPSQNEKDTNNCINENNQNTVEENQNIIQKDYEQSYEYLVNNLKCNFYDAMSLCSDTFYISARCENDIIKEIHYDDVVHNRTEDSSGIGIKIKTNEGIYTNKEYNSNNGAVYDMDMYYKILKNSNIKEMELINGMKYAYEVSERNNKVVHNSYCD